jgi:lysophospholipase L1-like esterase
MHTKVIRLLFVLYFSCCIVSGLAAEKDGADFGEFDRRARAGERLSVVFFGASLTWGANASDPMQTSYRALIAKRLEAKYPKAHFKFFDGAIGGTGSQLGIFRLERDVLRHKPDLVFLDFSANDGITTADGETLASYEAIVRRIITEAKAPVVQVAFPFSWDVQRGKLEAMHRRIAHKKISKTYSTAFGDAIALCKERIESKETALKKIWPFDGVHPGDAGYVVFADAAWVAFEKAIKDKRACVAPNQMLHGDTYLRPRRIRISSLKPLPAGWTVQPPNPVSAHFDMLMSRWLDDETVAAMPKGKAENVALLKMKFRGSMVMLFGESTEKSVKYRVLIDDKLVTREEKQGGKTVVLKEFNGAELAARVKGNCHHVQILATGLDPKREHTLEIQPLFTGKAGEELRLESICVAGNARLEQ